jgi:integrase
MSSDTSIEEKMAEAAEEAVASDGSFIPGVSRTDITDTDDFGDFEYWAWEQYYNRGKTAGTVSLFFTAVSSLERFVDESNKIHCSADNITDRETPMFKRWLLGQIEPYTASQYINHLDNMCQHFVANDYYPGNPFEGLAETIDSKSRQSSSFQTNERTDVDDSRLREAIRSTHGSSKIVLLAMLIKTGIRISEAINLDWEDIHIDHDISDDLIPAPRFELSDDPDTIYIDADKTGEDNPTDSAGNKRKVNSVIPIDGELKRLLIWHALTRERRFDDENPVFMSGNNAGSDRLEVQTAWRRIMRLAKEYGWWESGRSELRNVTPHWFRAKFVTYMSNRLEDAEDSDKSDFNGDSGDIVKGLRGDVAPDIVETYRLRDGNQYEHVRSHQFKIGLEGM